MSGAWRPPTEGLRERFLAAGPELTEGHGPRRTADPGYSALALELLGERPFGLFLVEGPGRTAARGMVTVQAGRPDTALLGLYEAPDGVAGDDATRQLVARATEWARQAGCARLLAPVDGSTWLSYRFRAPDPKGESAEDPGVLPWEPTTPACYLERFHLAGFQETLEFETLGLVFPEDGSYGMRDAAARTQPAAEAVEAAGYRIRNVREWGDTPPWTDLHRFISDAFSENPLFAPIPLEAFRRLYAGALGPEALGYSHWIEDSRGRMCALTLAFRQGRAVVLKSVGVDPAHRGRGLSTATTHKALVHAASEGLSEIVTALVRRGNPSESHGRRHLMSGVRSWRHRYVLLGQEVHR